jgi:hypothetical protein
VSDLLKKRQEAGQEVERLMIEFLIQYHPTHDLKVADVIQIAHHARRLAFDLFSEIEARS